MQIKETWLNKGKNYINGESGWYEPFTNSPKKLFQSCQKQYGKCVSKMYIEIPYADGTSKVEAIGWVFEKKQTYNRSDKTFIQEVWVEVRKTKPMMM